MSDLNPSDSAEPNPVFEIDELDEGALEEASGGGVGGLATELNALADCGDTTTNTNCAGANCIAGCT